MTRYGFLIDQDSCIGCHACSVACKSENDVPLGVNRTWLKYIEKGTFPETRRLYSVMRCNHCENPPCVAICPTGALFKRADGIVDFDTSACIGCKSCMNACPYDAIYIDPEEHTAQKCNFCSHRIELGLEPACVVVCPTQAIVAGDLDDPTSKIARMVARSDVHVRAPEQGTRPKLFYRGADEASLVPTRSAIPPDGLMWAEATAGHPTPPADGNGSGDIVARTVHTTAHPAPWGAKVSAYLVTKALGAGALMIAALLVALGGAGNQLAVGVLPPVLAGTFLGLTGVLLVADLKQPKRFHFLLTRPNWTSWLARGSIVLGLYALVAAAWFLAGLLDATGAVQALAVPGVLLGAAAAGYTAYLFGQCEGRDFWQTPLLLPILLAQAVVAGAALFLVADLFVTVPEAGAVRWALLGGLAAVAILAGAEVTARGSVPVELAAHAMTRGAYARRFWGLGVLVGMAVPAVLVVAALAGIPGATAAAALAGVAAVAGLAGFEDAFVRAGQSVPLS
ncbi:MAG TPA: 4Fe-4S dicluster domain-containing protein [Acidimicrobiales bacterium]|nr:4Fe-4S dicluster domain-containing protein [Acidimicrobiales bacterium]